MENLIIKDKSLIMCYYDVANIKIPDGVKIIESFAFKGRKIKSVEIPDSVEKICTHAFYHCDNLETIEIPDSVTYIDSFAFAGCINLKSVVLPKRLRVISEYMFSNCVNLTHIYIPDSVEKICYNSFCNCKRLYQINIPKELRWISSGAFRYSGLTSLIIPPKSKLISISEYVFEHCEKLSQISIPNNIQHLGRDVFDKCKKRESFNFNFTKKEKVVAYKGFNKYSIIKGIYCRNFKYEEGKTYEVEKALLCVYGFHACLNPLDIFNYYNGDVQNLEFHEVILEGVTGEISDDSKICGTKITIGRKLTIEDLCEIYNSIK